MEKKVFFFILGGFACFVLGFYIAALSDCLKDLQHAAFALELLKDKVERLDKSMEPARGTPYRLDGIEERVKDLEIRMGPKRDQHVLPE